jgi:uncharacterized protein YndB with AHSA1/START domain
MRTNEELGRIMSCFTLKFERKSKHSAERVWKAITDSDELTKWMRYPIKVDLKRGGTFFADFAPDDPIDGVITTLDPGKVFAYSWGRSVVEWTVEPDGDGSKYTFIHQGLERFEGDEGMYAGWHAFLDALDLHMEGKHMSKEEDAAEWERLKPIYKEVLASVE